MPSSPGKFSYPPPGSNLQFNSIDSVVASWLTFDSGATDCSLSVWYWPGADPWRRGYNQTAPANGTATVPLNVADGSSYIGQLNFFYTDSGGGREKFVGPTFDVGGSSQGRAVTWSQSVQALSTSSVSASLQTSSVSTSLQTSILESLVISTVSPATVTVSNQVPTRLSSSETSAVQKSSSTNSAHLGTGAIVGIVVGIVACAGLAAAFIFYRRKKQLSPPPPAHWVVEKDDSPLQWNELPGGSEPVEIARHDEPVEIASDSHWR